MPARRPSTILGPLAALLLCGGAPALAGEGAAAAEAATHLGSRLPLWSVIPFAGILLSIAVLPVAATRFWHDHYPKVAAMWALLLAVPFLLSYRMEAVHAIVHIYLVDYVPFIILLWGLFTVAGGIVVRGTPRGTPAVNTVLLAIGTVLASLVGTTGAAMLLIRPILRANAHRRSRTHIVVFFIFLVANIGGSLTPLGDPPLFLGFLHSVPFFWTLLHMPGPLLMVAGILLAFFYVLDRMLVQRELRQDGPHPAEGPKRPLEIAGARNFILLGGIVGAVLMSGLWHAGSVHILGVDLAFQDLARDVIIVLCGLISLLTTSKELRRENDFTWGPIREVAYLFAGIFMTIVPALEILKAGEAGALAGLIRTCRDPWHYYWITGTLSSFLDNAPTYLTFFNTALGRFYPGMEEHAAVANLIATHNHYLLAIS
ncbi:MAG: sodium:proton antiporter, partial [Acidobacteria bacterium]